MAGTILTIQQSYTYNASSQLKSVSNSSNVTIADFRYDASGMRVLSKVNGVKTIRIGGIYEKEITGTGATAVTKVTKYYDGVALRVGSGTLQYLHRDHLGGVIAITNSSGAITRQERYKPFGETLWSAGTNTPTTQAYTGQKRESSFGLYDYNARWYDSALGRFTQADTIVPNPASAKAFDRYAYVYNNPINHNDPSGHICSDPDAPTRTCENNSSGYGNSLNGWTPTISIEEEDIEQIAAQFGIKFLGGWTTRDKQVILNDVLLLALRLREASGFTATSLADIFKIAHGEGYTIKLMSMNGFCAIDTTGFSCNYDKLSGQMDEYAQQGLSIHEMGHSFDHYVRRGGGRAALDNAEIRDQDGNLVAGQGIRTNDGYRSGWYPDQQHPLNADFGDNNYEDYADMYMNWAQNSFAADVAGAGAARYQWMNQHVTSRVKSQALYRAPVESIHHLGKSLAR